MWHSSQVFLFISLGSFLFSLFFLYLNYLLLLLPCWIIYELHWIIWSINEKFDEQISKKILSASVWLTIQLVESKASIGLWRWQGKACWTTGTTPKMFRFTIMPPVCNGCCTQPNPTQPPTYHHVNFVCFFPHVFLLIKP